MTIAVVVAHRRHWLLKQAPTPPPAPVEPVVKAGVQAATIANHGVPNWAYSFRIVEAFTVRRIHLWARDGFLLDAGTVGIATGVNTTRSWLTSTAAAAATQQQLIVDVAPAQLSPGTTYFVVHEGGGTQIAIEQNSPGTRINLEPVANGWNRTYYGTDFQQSYPDWHPRFELLG